MDNIEKIIEIFGVVVEILGIITIVSAAFIAIILAIQRLAKGSDKINVYRSFRKQLGRGILLGLEFLVAGDIINTVAIKPGLRSVGALAIIVVIRTFLSFTLEVEMTGHWPWQCQERKRGE